MQDRDRLTDVGSELVTTSRWKWGGTNWGYGINRHKRLYINTRNILHSAGIIAHLIITYNGV